VLSDADSAGDLLLIDSTPGIDGMPANLGRIAEVHRNLIGSVAEESCPDCGRGTVLVP
jgi:hypothetical protein